MIKYDNAFVEINKTLKGENREKICKKYQRLYILIYSGTGSSILL